jgi:conjugal transfer pilus assembly protein TraE
MKFDLREQRFSHLHFQRNVLGGFVLCLLPATSILAVLLFFKQERIVVHPPELRQSYWVEGNRFAPAYLEEMGLYFAHLLLDVSPANILYQGDVLLRYVWPKTYGEFRSRIMEDQKRLKQENVSMVFNPVECTVIPGQMAVEIHGDLVTFVADKKISSRRESYRVAFEGKSGRLFLKSFTLLLTASTQENEE